MPVKHEHVFRLRALSGRLVGAVRAMHAAWQWQLSDGSILLGLWS